MLVILLLFAIIWIRWLSKSIWKRRGLKSDHDNSLGKFIPVQTFLMINACNLVVMQFDTSCLCPTYTFVLTSVKSKHSMKPNVATVMYCKQRNCCGCKQLQKRGLRNSGFNRIWTSAFQILAKFYYQLSS